MWLCTKLGFYSISAKMDDEIHLRARSKRDLENLRHHCTGRIPGASAWEIHRSAPPADYRWRIVIDERDLAPVMLALAATLDYANFKGEIANRDDQRTKFPIYSDFHHDLEDWQNSRVQ